MGIFVFFLAFFLQAPRPSPADPAALLDQHVNPLETILMARGVLTDASRSFDVPVDSSVLRLLVATAADPGLSATLFRPAGAVVTEFDADTTVTTVTGARGYTIAAPQPGLWRLEISGSPDPGAGTTRFAIIVRANSRVGLDTFEFVRYQAEVHRGYFHVDGEPLVGSRPLGRAVSMAGPSTASFRTVDAGGATLSQLALSNSDPATTSDAWVGAIPLPNVPFSIVMNAVDRSGAPIQRQWPTFITAQPVAVSVPLQRRLPIVRGGSGSVSFAVTNVGATANTFALSASATVGRVRDLTPKTLTLGPGQSSSAAFSLDIPPDAWQGDPIDVVMVAQSTTAASVRNSTTLKMMVARDDDLDDDSVPDVRDNCPGRSNADQIDADFDGIGDACDPVVERRPADRR